MKALPANDGSLPWRRFDVDAEAGEHELGVVARGCRLVDARRSRREDTGEQNCRLQLGRSNRRVIGDRREAARSRNGERERLRTFRSEPSTHELEWIRDPAHRAAAKGRIARKLDGDAPWREHAHEQANRRAGIAAIDGAFRLRRTRTAPPADVARKASIRPLFEIDLGAQNAHGADGRAHVGGVEHAGHMRSAFGHRGEEHRAMRNRLVAGNANRTGQRTGERLDEGCLPGCCICGLGVCCSVTAHGGRRLFVSRHGYAPSGRAD